MTFSTTLVALAAAVLSYVLTGVALRILLTRAILDRPNERSSHVRPTPRGGGLAVVAALVPALLATAGLQGELGRLLPVVAGIVVLAALSFADDLKDLPAGARLIGQAVAVGLGLLALPEGAVLQGWLPWWLDRLLIAIGWLWFVNLFNFMDGIDGITAVETMAIGLGVAAVALVLSLPGAAGSWGLVAAAVAAGFLPWNWQPAKIFLGDVGSVPLGYLLGFLLLSLAAQGFLAAALVLPLYYVADATVTLLKRLLRGEQVWKAHREHWYQKAAAATRHDTVSLRIAAGNAVLLAVAVAAAALSPAFALLGAAIVGLLVVELRRLARAGAAG